MSRIAARSCGTCEPSVSHFGSLETAKLIIYRHDREQCFARFTGEIEVRVIAIDFHMPKQAVGEDERIMCLARYRPRLSELVGEVGDVGGQLINLNWLSAEFVDLVDKPLDLIHHDCCSLCSGKASLACCFTALAIASSGPTKSE